MRWIPFIAFFLYVYIEISIFIQVAHVLGVFMTLILVIFSSVVGMSLVRNQGFKNFLLMQQKMAAGESPAAEMIRERIADYRWSAAVAPGVLYRLPRPAAIAAAGAKAFDDEADAAPALQPDAGRRL